MAIVGKRTSTDAFDRYLAIATGVLVIITVFVVSSGCRIVKRVEGFYGGAEKSVVQYFRMDGCPHCVMFDPVWKQATSKGSKTVTFEVHPAGGPEASKHGITGYPHVQKVSVSGVQTFEGKRDVENLNRFIAS